MTEQNSWHDSAEYHIVVKGRLENRLGCCFEGMAIKSKDGITKISGQVVDQAALHGLLVRICDLGLLLISVKRLESGQNVKT